MLQPKEYLSPLLDKSIWILEDDKHISFVYSDILNGIAQTKIFETLEEFENALSESHPDLLIADLIVSDGFFVDWLKAFNSQSSQSLSFPFMVVSSVEDIDVLRKCFDDGAVDYLTKPFHEKELLVKLERSLLGNSKNYFGIEFDPTLLIVTRNKEQAELTQREFQILNMLAQSSEGLSRDEIVNYVWNGTCVGRKTLDVHLHRVRKKVEPLGIKIDFIPPTTFKLSCKRM